jgi:hypothetical protein
MWHSDARAIVVRNGCERTPNLENSVIHEKVQMAEKYVGESYGTPSEGVNHSKGGALATRIELSVINEVHNRAHIKRIRG